MRLKDRLALTQILKKLDKIPKIKWAAIYCTFNRWGFPNEMDDVKPKWWTEDDENGMTRDSDRKILINIPVMDIIKSTLGERWVSRECNKDRMTEEEHNDWWIKNHINKKI